MRKMLQAANFADQTDKLKDHYNVLITNSSKII